jgi:1-acyl-sn-glycerol-3-phosphate acyltransferase
MLPNALSWVRSLLFTIPLITAFTVGVGIAALAGALLGLRGDFQNRCLRLGAQMVLHASLVRVTVSGLEKIYPAKTYVFCSNHLSYMDPPVLLACLGHRVRFLAKKSLFSMPFLGWAMWGAGYVPIERENPRAAARSLARAANTIRSGNSIILFPEGSRSRDGALQPFLSGGFRLAIEVQAPVVPLAIAGTRQVLAPGSIHVHGGRVQLIVGDPIPTLGMTAGERKKLAARVRNNIKEMLL